MRPGQLGWMLFLKILDDREEEYEIERADYSSPIPEELPADATQNPLGVIVRRVDELMAACTALAKSTTTKTERADLLLERALVTK
ncbi:MAG: hypothetical protein WD492_15475 [Alkalispirochaeta sp.]